MNELLKKTIEDFYNLEKFDSCHAIDTLFKIRQFVLPLLKCRFMDNEAIDLENKLFKYLDPANFFNYVLPCQDYWNYNALLKECLYRLNTIFLPAGYRFKYLHRIKSVYSSLNTMIEKTVFILDKFGIRIIFDIAPQNFYQFAWWIVLVLKENFEVVSVKDYIANPRKTGYSAIHVLIFNQIFIEIQITYLNDAKIKLPHFCYKQHIASNNLYISENAHSAYNRIFQDFKNYLECHS